MFCPKCRCEYVEGITRCSRCKIDLVKELEKTGEIDYRDIKLKSLCKVQDSSEAYLIKGLLEGENIKVFIKPYEVVLFDGICFPMEALWGEIFVEDSNLEEAEKIINEYLSAEAVEGGPIEETKEEEKKEEETKEEEKKEEKTELTDIDVTDEITFDEMLLVEGDLELTSYTYSDGILNLVIEHYYYDEIIELYIKTDAVTTSSFEINVCHLELIELEEALYLDDKGFFVPPSDPSLLMEDVMNSYHLAYGKKASEYKFLLSLKGYTNLISCLLRSKDDVKIS